MPTPRAPTLLLTLVLVLAGAAPARAVSVGPAGALDGPEGSAQRHPTAVGLDRTTYLVVFEDDRGAGTPAGIDLYAAFVDVTGREPPSLPVPLLGNDPTLTRGDQLEPHLAMFGAREAFLTWIHVHPDGGREVRLILFDMDTLEPSPFVSLPLPDVDGVPDRPVIAGGSDHAYLTYRFSPSRGAPWLVGQYVIGTMLYDDPVVLFTNADTFAQMSMGFYEIWAFGSQDGDIWFSPVDRRERRVRPSYPLGPPTTDRTHVAIGGRTDVVVAWEDARGPEPSIWGAEVDIVEGRIVGPERRFSFGAGGQRRPVATSLGASRFFVAWEQARSGAGPVEIWGTAWQPYTGGVRQEEVQLLADPAGVSEATFSRSYGSYADRLLVAVRGGPEPRVVYREVNPRPSYRPHDWRFVQGVADGAEPVTLRFDQSRDPDRRLAPPPGILFDVELSSPHPRIVDPDAAPWLPGHQIAVSDFEGHLDLSLTSTVPEEVEVKVEPYNQGHGGLRMYVTVEFSNAPPFAARPQIGPTAPRTTDDLRLSYLYLDRNGDPETARTIRWRRDGAEQPELEDTFVVPARRTAKGHVWEAEIQVSDGLDWSPRAPASVTVLNSPPQAEGLQLEGPDGPARVRPGQPLRLTYTYVDPDGDPERRPGVAWRLDGAHAPEFDDRLELPGEQVKAGQRWQAVLTVRDDTAEGAPTPSPEVLVPPLPDDPMVEVAPGGYDLDACACSGARTASRPPQPLGLTLIPLVAALRRRRSGCATARGDRPARRKRGWFSPPS